MTLNNEQIVALLEGYDNESKALKKEALTLAWYMRGGLSYEEAMYLSQSERETIGKIVESNMEVAKKTGMPFF